MARLISSDDLASLLRRPAPRPTPRQRAAENQLRVLKCISRYGHLTVADIGASCWPGMRSADDMARRTLQGLAPLVVARPNALGGRSFVLSKAGVTFLDGHGISASHGFGLAVAGPTFRHHSIAARYLIERESEGCLCWNEYAIARGAAPLSHDQLLQGYGKLPDGIIVEPAKPGQRCRLLLLEAESAHKHRNILMAACSVVSKVPRRLVPECPYEFGGLIFAFTADQNHGPRIAAACRTLWRDVYGADQQACLAARISLVRIAIDLPLTWRGYSTEPLDLFSFAR